MLAGKQPKEPWVEGEDDRCGSGGVGSMRWRSQTSSSSSSSSSCYSPVPLLLLSSLWGVMFSLHSFSEFLALALKICLGLRRFRSQTFSVVRSRSWSSLLQRFLPQAYCRSLSMLMTVIGGEHSLEVPMSTRWLLFRRWRWRCCSWQAQRHRWRHWCRWLWPCRWKWPTSQPPSRSTRPRPRRRPRRGPRRKRRKPHRPTQQQ